MKKIICFLLITIPAVSFAQFEPAAGQVGSTAIGKDSSAYKAWATSCKLFRGYMNMANPSSGLASAGDESATLGKAGTGGVASLGDGGSAVLTFDNPIANGNGYDFAVFENGFRLGGDTLDFLEFAFVEVSSDGIRFFRFPSQYTGDVSTQVGSFGGTDTRLYHNLAGKYTSGYGTPFDLEELKDETGLDVTNITHVRIVDVVGSINPAYATHDSKGNIVNDPWPTEFPSSGFDLDAVGVINIATTTGITDLLDNKHFNIYPNPSRDFIEIVTKNNQSYSIQLTDLSGKVLESWPAAENQRLDISQIQVGTYLVNLVSASQRITEKLLIR